MVVCRPRFKFCLSVAVTFSFFLMGYVISLPAQQMDFAEVHHGNVRIYHGPNGSVFIYIHSQGRYGNPNSSTPIVYLFQTNSYSKHNLPATIDNVEIVAKERSLRINPGNSGTNSMLLSLSNEFPEDDNLEVIYGYGFARYYGITQSPAELACNVFPEDCYTTKDKPPILDDWGDGGAASCQSGGTGSSACSIDCGSLGCSTSCNTGYYACCNCFDNGPSCKCFSGP